MKVNIETENHCVYNIDLPLPGTILCLLITFLIILLRRCLLHKSQICDEIWVLELELKVKKKKEALFCFTKGCAILDLLYTTPTFYEFLQNLKYR